MLINATLFVQAAHFLFAYLILHRFLFKPVVALIHDEDSTKERLENTIYKRKVEIEEKERTKNRRWIECQGAFEKTIPNLFKRRARPTLPEISDPDIPYEHVKTVIQEIENSIITKVKHVG